MTHVTSCQPAPFFMAGARLHQSRPSSFTVLCTSSEHLEKGPFGEKARVFFVSRIFTVQRHLAQLEEDRVNMMTPTSIVQSHYINLINTN